MTWGPIVQSAHVLLLVICQVGLRRKDPEMKKNARTTRFEHLMCTDLPDYLPATLISWKITEVPPQCNFGNVAFAYTHMLVKYHR